MVDNPCIDWFDVDAAASRAAGNWRTFRCFAWSRAHDLTDGPNWLIFYTSNRDSDLLAASNEEVFRRELRDHAEGDDPDVVWERHAHWACGHIDGFSLRAYGPDGSVTPAFRAFCELRQRLDGYPVLDEPDLSEREYAATHDNYRAELGRLSDGLPEGWAAEVHEHFANTGRTRFTENRDGHGGWAPQDELVGALVELDLLPA